ncbi:MAG: DUF6062 family protein [Candidatus Bathyarchaeia archaeon]
MSLDVAYLRIKRAIECEEECFLCVLEEEIENKFMDTYLSELVMDASSRRKIIESRGFCNYHFYKMLIAANKPGSPDGHGIALTMHSVVEQLLLDISKVSGYKNAYRNIFPSEEKCPACTHLASFTEMYIQKVVELLSLQNKEFMKLFKESRGLCIPHFAALIRAIEEKLESQAQDIIKTVIEVEKKNLGRLNSELAEYIRRQSYEFSEEDRKAVKETTLKGVGKLVGRHGLRLREG